MSVLSDALKRQQQERGGDTSFPCKSGSEQNEPPPLPEAPEEKQPVAGDGHARHSREWAAKALVAIGLLVVLAGLGLPYYFFPMREPSQTGVDQPAVEQAVALIEPEPAPVPEPALVEVEAPPEAAPVERERIEPETSDALPMDEVVAPEPEAVMWPDIRVQAAMGSGGTGSVLIDGEITLVGERYREVLIREITPQGVLLEYQGEERVVRIRR